MTGEDGEVIKSKVVSAERAAFGKAKRMGSVPGDSPFIIVGDLNESDIRKAAIEGDDRFSDDVRRELYKMLDSRQDSLSFPMINQVEKIAGQGRSGLTELSDMFMDRTLTRGEELIIARMYSKLAAFKIMEQEGGSKFPATQTDIENEADDLFIYTLKTIGRRQDRVRSLPVRWKPKVV